MGVKKNRTSFDGNPAAGSTYFQMERIWSDAWPEYYLRGIGDSDQKLDG